MSPCEWWHVSPGNGPIGPLKMRKPSDTCPPAMSTSVLPRVLRIACCHPYYHVIGDDSCHVCSEDQSEVAKWPPWRRERKACPTLFFHAFPLYLVDTCPPATSTSVLPRVLCIACCHSYCHVIGDDSCHVCSEDQSEVAKWPPWRRERKACSTLFFHAFPLYLVFSTPRWCTTLSRYPQFAGLLSWNLTDLPIVDAMWRREKEGLPSLFCSPLLC